ASAARSCSRSRAARARLRRRPPGGLSLGPAAFPALQTQCVTFLRTLAAFPSPLWGGVRGGGGAVLSRPALPSFTRTTPLPPPPHTSPASGRGSAPSLWRERTEFAALPRAVAQHEAGAAGAADAAAQRLRGGARVGAHAHLIERLRAAAAQERAQQARIAPGENVGVALGEARGARQRVVAREAGGKLHAPRRRRHHVHALLELLHERVGRAMQQRYQLAAAGLGHLRRLALARARPLVDGDAGDGEHVVARLRRQRAAPR